MTTKKKLAALTNHPYRLAAGIRNPPSPFEHPLHRVELPHPRELIAGVPRARQTGHTHRQAGRGGRVKSAVSHAGGEFLRPLIGTYVIIFLIGARSEGSCRYRHGGFPGIRAGDRLIAPGRRRVTELHHFDDYPADVGVVYRRPIVLLGGAVWGSGHHSGSGAGRSRRSCRHRKEAPWLCDQSRKCRWSTPRLSRVTSGYEGGSTFGLDVRVLFAG